MSSSAHRAVSKGNRNLMASNRLSLRYITGSAVQKAVFKVDYSSLNYLASFDKGGVLERTRANKDEGSVMNKSFRCVQHA